MPVTTIKYSTEAGRVSLETLYSLHKDLVFRTAYSVIGNKFDAEDVRQSVFMKLVQYGIPDMSNSAGYFYTAALHEALKLVRTRGRYCIDGEDKPPPEPSTDGSPFEARMLEELLDAMARLEDRDVELLVLFYQKGHTDAEIAMLTDRTRGVIRAALVRARYRLQKILGSEGERQ